MSGINNIYCIGEDSPHLNRILQSSGHRRLCRIWRLSRLPPAPMFSCEELCSFGAPGPFRASSSFLTSSLHSNASEWWIYFYTLIHWYFRDLYLDLSEDDAPVQTKPGRRKSSITFLDNFLARKTPIELEEEYKRQDLKYQNQAIIDRFIKNKPWQRSSLRLSRFVPRLRELWLCGDLYTTQSEGGGGWSADTRHQD